MAAERRVDQEIEGWLMATGWDPATLRATLSRAVASSCPAWLRAQCEDIVQDAVERVLKMVRNDRPSRLSAAYVRKVAYSVLVDEIRRRRVREVVRSNDSRTSGGEPDRMVESARLAADLGDCLQHIGSARAEAVVLHLQGFTRAEVASLLAQPDKKTDNLIYRGLAALRKCLRSRGHAT